MKENKVTSLQEMLEQLPTEQLDEMLHAELKKKPVDENAVRLIMHILEEREKDISPEITPGIEEAWEQYQQDIAQIDRKADKPRRVRRLLLRAASMAAVFLVLLMAVIPKQAGAESLWEKLARWSDSIFEFFSPGDEEIPEEYKFQTDNPGLQQVYDAVTELGVTEPVVPMWLPEGYELVECTAKSGPKKNYVLSRFANEDDEMVFRVNIHAANIPGQYQKDNTQVKQIELHGLVYNIMSNNDRWVVAWVKDDLECFITIDCEEELLSRMLKSIHVMEDMP